MSADHGAEPAPPVVDLRVTPALEFTEAKETHVHVAPSLPPTVVTEWDTSVQSSARGVFASMVTYLLCAHTGRTYEPTDITMYEHWFKGAVNDMGRSECICAKLLLFDLTKANEKVHSLENKGSVHAAIAEILLAISAVISLLTASTSFELTMQNIQLMMVVVTACNIMTGVLNRRKTTTHLPQLMSAACDHAAELDMLAREFFTRQNMFHSEPTNRRAELLHARLTTSNLKYTRAENEARSGSTSNLELDVEVRGHGGGGGGGSGVGNRRHQLP